MSRNFKLNIMRIKLIGLLICFFSCYFGYDGLNGNFNLKKISLEEVEHNGVGSNRFLEINNCYATGGFVYNVNKKVGQNDKIDFVVFPIINKTEYQKILNSALDTSKNDGKNATTYVLVKRNPNNYYDTCANGDGSCLNDLIGKSLLESNGFTVKGVTISWLEDLTNEQRQMIKSLHINMSDNVIMLQEDTKPKSKMISIVILAFGIIGFLLILATWIVPKKK